MKSFSFLAFFLLSTWACAQKPCKVEGTIKGDPTLTQWTLEANGNKQTIEVKKGKFGFTSQTEGVVKGWLQRVDGQVGMPLNVYLVPGESLKLSFDGADCQYGGSKLYKEFAQADAVVGKLKRDYTEFFEHCLSVLNATPQDRKPEVNQVLIDSMNVFLQAYEEGMYKYLDEHKGSQGAVLFLCDHVALSKLYDALDEPMRGTLVGQYVKSLVDEQKRKEEERARVAAEEKAQREAMTGKPALDFTLNDLEGKPLSLSSLRGKYVVLDWWGSWCGWCLYGFPEMKKYYEKYAGKMEILGIDCRDTEDQWKECVEKEKLPWLHVYNPRKSTLADDYKISGYPTKIIVDPDGKINKIFVGEDPAFYTYLDELFGK